MANSQTKNLRSFNETVIDEVLTRQVAAASLGGTSVADIAKELAISAASVRKIQGTPKYKELVTRAGEEELGPLLAKAKAGLARLSAKAVKVVEKAMDSALDGSGSMREGLAAAQVALKATGIHEEKEAQQDTQIIIKMPDGVSPVTYEVVNENKEEDQE